MQRGAAGLRDPKIERRHVHSAANHSIVSEVYRLPVRDRVLDHNSRETDCPKGWVRELVDRDMTSHLHGGPHSPRDAFKRRHRPSHSPQD